MHVATNTHGRLSVPCDHSLFRNEMQHTFHAKAAELNSVSGQELDVERLAKDNLVEFLKWMKEQAWWESLRWEGHDYCEDRVQWVLNPSVVVLYVRS